MRVELANGWIELDGEIVLSSSFASIEEAEAYVTHAVREKSIEQSMLEFISSISKAFSRNSPCEADDLNNSVWASILKLRDDPNRWNVRYLKGRAVYAAKQILRGLSADLLPIDGDCGVEPTPSFPDLYELIAGIKSDRQRTVMELTAHGLAPQAIADELELTVVQVRNALSKGSANLKNKVGNMSPQQKADLR